MGAMLTMVVAGMLQTYRDVREYHRAPLPSEFTADVILFGGLAALDGFTDSNLGSWIAAGILVAVVLQAGGPGNLVNQGVPDPLGKFLNGPGAIAQAPGKGRGTGSLIGPGRNPIYKAA